MADGKLTKEQAAVVLRKNQQNIIRKAAEGKTLSIDERRQLEEVAEIEPEPKTAQELANALGVSRRTIFHLRKTANAPEGNVLSEWREYLEARALETGDGKSSSQLPEEVASARMRLLKAQAGKEEANRKLREYELEVKEQNLVPMADAKAAVRRVLSPLRGLLDGLPKAVAHHANPTNAIMAEEAIDEGLAKIFEMMKEELNGHDSSNE